MADTSQTAAQAEQTRESCSCLVSEALYMDWETAMHHVKALFAAIRAMGNAGLTKEDETHIVDLAALGERIVEDQFLSLRTNKEARATSEEF